MNDPRIEGLARVIVGYSLELQEGQSFFISSGTAAEPLVQALYEEALRAGANPVLDLSLEGTQTAFYELAGEEQIEWVSPPQRWAFEEADARIRVLSDTNVRELSNVAPDKQTRRQRAMLVREDRPPRQDRDAEMDALELEPRSIRRVIPEAIGEDVRERAAFLGPDLLETDDVGIEAREGRLDARLTFAPRSESAPEVPGEDAKPGRDQRPEAALGRIHRTP